jgi:hypothetical protein
MGCHIRAWRWPNSVPSPKAGVAARRVSFLLLPEERQLLVEAVGIEHEAIVDQELMVLVLCMSASQQPSRTLRIMAMAFFIT